MLSKLWFSPMITTTCLIGVVVGAAWLACGVVLPAAAAVIMTATAAAAPATSAGCMSFLGMRTPFPSPWAGVLAPHRPVPGSVRHTFPKRAESGMR